MKIGDHLQLEAGELAFGGETVCRDPASGMVVFVSYLAPGDVARIRIEHVRARFARGRAVEIIRSGPDRVTPPCSYFGTCGGCQWQHVSLAAQRAAKERIVRHQLSGLGLAERVDSVRGDDTAYRYRNRLLLPVRAGRRGLRAGFFRAGSHRVVDIEECAVQKTVLWEAASAAVEIANAAGIQGYNETTGTGDLRHLLVRAGAGSEEVGVVFVTTREDLPRMETVGSELMRRCRFVTGVAQNVNPARTNVIVGPDTHSVAGKSFVTERVGSLVLKASLPVFFQANAAITEMMVQLVREWTAGETGGILDLYCGVGVLGLSAIEAGTGVARPAWLVGVEEVEASVRDARENAHGMAGVRFESGTVEDVLPRIAEDLSDVGTVIVDPPRKGLTRPALEEVVRLGARQLIYVSCDPATFARDLAALVESGYRLETVVPLDMFPQTYHIELAARLIRGGGA